ncbi:tigger transposable element-derived protein 4-like [Saccostrea cucullata]|uniref:tigger transposable element-derived protein 4-like n=1 Tax=Saccostrea cuccullata TaxID=36930 RepID=UPI002ED166D3
MEREVAYHRSGGSAKIQQYESSFGPQRKKMRKATYENTEQAVLQWFKAARDKNIPVSGPLLMAKSEEFATQLGDTQFKCSTGWLDRFKERHAITFKRLFFRLLPDKTLEFKCVDCHGGKSSKDRLTVLACANMSGSDKLPLLVIGKAKNPRCFKNVKSLPTSYEANSKAWITSELFTNWVRKLDRKFHYQGRKVALVVDNCPAHPKVTGLKAVSLIFLPPNTTSKTQPMDQGIIQNLKVHYRKLVILRQLKAIENQTELTISVLDAMRMLNQAWAKVSEKTIQNCFRHANFTSAPEEEAVSEDEDPDDDIPLAALRLRIPLDEYAGVDDNLETSEATTDAAIVENILSAGRNCDEDAGEDDEDDVQAPPVKKPPMKAVSSAVELICTWAEMTENTSDLLPTLQKIQQRITVLLNVIFIEKVIF